MDSSTVVQIIAGILFVIGLVFLIQRRRKKVA
jgi:LPXTG-motif cell wall-anchored protein